MNKYCFKYFHLLRLYWNINENLQVFNYKLYENINIINMFYYINYIANLKLENIQNSTKL